MLRKTDLLSEIADLREENTKIKSENKDLRFELVEKEVVIDHIVKIIQNGDATGENFFMTLDKIKIELDAYQNNLVQ